MLLNGKIYTFNYSVCSSKENFIKDFLYLHIPNVKVYCKDQNFQEF